MVSKHKFLGVAATKIAATSAKTASFRAEFTPLIAVRTSFKAFVATAKRLKFTAFAVAILLAFGAVNMNGTTIQEAKKFKKECDETSNFQACAEFADFIGKKHKDYKSYAEKVVNLCNDTKTCLRALKFTRGEASWQAEMGFWKAEMELRMRLCDEFNHIETCKTLPRDLYHEKNMNGSFPEEFYKKYIVHYEKKNCDAGTFYVYGKIDRMFPDFYNDCARAAERYYYGNLADENIDEALKYYAKACDVVQDRNRANYCVKIANHYKEIEEKKEITERDYSQTLKWHKKACAIDSNHCKSYNEIKKLWSE